MSSYRSVAASVAKSKEAHPEQFCPSQRCLWRTGNGSRCPRHFDVQIGARFLGGEGKFTWTLEYVGLNPAPEYEAQDRYIVRVVETNHSGPKLGTESKVEAKWFETHKELRK
jgi:hypothetical protein